MTRATEFLEPQLRTRLRRHLWWIVLAVVILQTMVVAGISFSSVLLVSAILAGTVVLFASLFSVEKVLILTLIYVAVLPIESYRYPQLPIAAQPKVIAAFLFLLLFLWLARSSLREELPAFTTSMDWLFASFLAVTVIAGVVGHLRSHDIGVLARDFQPLAYYGVYFLVVNSVSDRGWTRDLFIALTAITLVISAEYVYILARMVTGAGTLMPRLVTRQANLALISIPFLTSTALFARSGRQKVLCLALSFPVIVMAIISLQRALWIALLFSVLVVLSLVAAGRERLSTKRVFRLVALSLALVLAASVVGVKSLQRIAGSRAGTTVAARALTIGALTRDAAVAMRFVEYRAVMEHIRQHPLLGNGLGSLFYSRFGGFKPFVDSSYITLWWKTGLVGLAILLWLMAVFLHRCFRLYRESSDEAVRIIAVGVLGCFAGLLFVAVSSAILVRYRFNIIWAVIIGTVEILWRKRFLITSSGLPLENRH